MRHLLLLVALLVSTVAISADQPTQAQTVFAELKTLVGDWKSASAKSATVVSYRLIANDTALVESWTMSPTRQSMTVYTLDGNRLIATHYCPQGNAPRLALTSKDAAGTAHFVFFDGANLQDKAASHEHAFSLRIDPSGTLVRSETYIGNGDHYDPVRDKGEAESFTRVK